MQQRKKTSVILFGNECDFTVELRGGVVQLIEKRAIHNYRPQGQRVVRKDGLHMTPIWYKMDLDPATANGDYPLGLSTAWIDPGRLHIPGEVLQKFAEEQGDLREKEAIEKLLSAGFKTFRKVTECLVQDNKSIITFNDDTKVVLLNLE